MSKVILPIEVMQSSVAKVSKGQFETQDKSVVVKLVNDINTNDEIKLLDLLENHLMSIETINGQDINDVTFRTQL